MINKNLSLGVLAIPFDIVNIVSIVEYNVAPNLHQNHTNAQRLFSSTNCNLALNIRLTDIILHIMHLFCRYHLNRYTLILEITIYKV